MLHMTHVKNFLVPSTIFIHQICPHLSIIISVCNCPVQGSSPFRGLTYLPVSLWWWKCPGFLCHKLLSKSVHCIRSKSVTSPKYCISGVSILNAQMRLKLLISDSYYIIPYIISGMIKPSQLYVSAPSDQNLGSWKALGAHTSNKNGW